MTTIFDIAQRLGLSTATVSNALTGKGRVSEARRKHILDVAAEMGYDFNRVRTVSPRRTIVVFVETLSVIFCTKITEGICRYAENSGYHVNLHNLDILYPDDNINPPRESIREKLQRITSRFDSSVSGVIYVSQYPRDVTGIMPPLSCPVVYAYCYTNDGAPSVNTDDQQGAYIAVQHLLGLCKTNIAMVSGPINSVPMTKRFLGYQRALIDAGMSIDLEMVKLGDWNIRHSCEIMEELLRLKPRIDGVFCQSDHIALGVCQAIRNSGRQIPQDIAVVGFDNYDFAEFVSPTLTTIDQPLDDIGKTAFSQLQGLIEKQNIGKKDILLEARLIIRESA